jgi:hypothetical protein
VIAAAKIAAAVTAATVPIQQHCGDGWMGVNLVATPKVKQELRAAYVAAHPRARVGTPLAGHTYYGSYSGTEYAVATFAAHPTVFRRDARGRWRVRSETHGGICKNIVPIDLIKTWWLERWNSRCYVEPSTT